jgi:ketosteroid isomerase-like protein
MGLAQNNGYNQEIGCNCSYPQFNDNNPETIYNKYTYNRMNLTNKDILLKANACVTAGDYTGFLSWCTDDVIWEFVGDKTLSGKEAVSAYMETAYIEPPEFNIETLMEEGDLLSSIGKITMKDRSGTRNAYAYCDIWHFRNGKMARLKAFVININNP